MISSGRYKEEFFLEVLTKLANQELLDEKYKDHSLIGQKRPVRELHICPDWLLIYLVDDKQLILTVIQNGTHSDLFGHKQQF